MKTSDSLVNFAPAFLKAQKLITFAAKDTAHPFFKSKYADLPCVIDAVKSAMNDSGIMFMQAASPSEHGYLAMTTRLMHESGEWIEDTATLPLPKADPQGYGSASTYARRYGLAAICGLYQDDDDGNAAQKPAVKSIKAELPESSKSITLSVWDEQEHDTKIALQLIADEAIEIFKYTGAPETIDFLQKQELNTDEKVAIFSRFDSKMRAFLKKKQDVSNISIKHEGAK
jgi:hypothetical protein